MAMLWVREAEINLNSIEVRFCLKTDKDSTSYIPDIARYLASRYKSVSKSEIEEKLYEIHEKLTNNFESDYNHYLIYRTKKDRESVREITRTFYKLMDELNDWIVKENQKRLLHHWLWDKAEILIPDGIIKPVREDSE